MSPNRILDGNAPLHRSGLHKPVIAVLITTLLAIINYFLGDSETHDIISCAIIWLTFGVGAAIIAVFTEDWTWGKAGLMISLAGASLTYGLILTGLLGLTDFSQLATRSIIRATLDNGGVLLCLGLMSWGYLRYQGKREQPFSK